MAKSMKQNVAAQGYTKLAWPDEPCPSADAMGSGHQYRKAKPYGGKALRKKPKTMQQQRARESGGV